MIRRIVLNVGMVSVALLTLLAMINFVYAQESGPQGVDAPQAALGTAFTYQGQLKSSGAEVTGSCEMAFRLFDAVTVGNPVGAPVTQTVTVNASLFTAQLDFGASAFDGQARWLEIAVKCASDASFTTLSRQALTAAPYALYAPTAGMAANVTNGVYTTGTYADPAWLTSLAGSKISGAVATATTAGGAPWSGVTGIPAGFADGTDNTANYHNVVIVAKSGGDYTTISAALASITDASATNHYLVKVMPGVYTETVTMKWYVDIEGAGELTTRITYTGSATAVLGTVVGANNAELRFLTVENTGGNTYAIAIYNSLASPRLMHLTAMASGGTSSNYGVYNSSSSPTMTDMTATATKSGGGFTRGVYNSSSSPRMTNVTATGSGGSLVYGVHNDFSSPMMFNVMATASGGSSDNWGVANTNTSSPTMTNVIATCFGGATCYAVFNMASTTIQNSVLSASGGTASYGINSNPTGSATYTVTVNNSQITGSTGTIRSNNRFAIFVGGSQLSGGAVNVNGGTVTCAGVYDENYTFYASTCP